jgi:hypothetical protein
VMINSGTSCPDRFCSSDSGFIRRRSLPNKRISLPLISWHIDAFACAWKTVQEKKFLLPHFR